MVEFWKNYVLAKIKKGMTPKKALLLVPEKWRDAVQKSIEQDQEEE